MTSDELRAAFKVLDRGGIFSHKVSKTALLKDRQYDPDKPFEQDFAEARSLLASLFDLPVERLSETYADNEWDCDDFGEAVCCLVKIINRKRSMKTGEPGDAYPIFPCALEEKHTIDICFKNGIRFGEPQTGETWTIEEYQPNVKFVG